MITLTIIICVIMYYRKLRKNFYEIYNIELPRRDYKIHKAKKKNELNYFELNYPHWIYFNKDGTRNKVRSNNGIVCEKSVFYIENYNITCDNPAYMIVLINNFRKKNPNITVQKSKEETEKYQKIYRKKQLEYTSNSIDGIISNFQDDPTEFEIFIANIYTKMGYITKVTPKTNDGGFDIVINKNDIKGILECKCFNQSHKIGRPLIQKLVGANITEKADELIFITTSDFSNEAKDYAKIANVRLINGSTLLKIISKVNDTNGDNVIVTEDDWSLDFDDLKYYIPSDINYIISYRKKKKR